MFSFNIKDSNMYHHENTRSLYAEHRQSEGSGVKVTVNRQLSVLGNLLKGTTAGLCPNRSYETTLQFSETGTIKIFESPPSPLYALENMHH